MANRRRRGRRGRRTSRQQSGPLTASIADRTGWDPPPPPRQAPRRLPAPNSRTKAVLAALAALPTLAAELGMKVAARPDGHVELLPGDPTTLVFHAGGQVRGLFVLPVDTHTARQQLGMAPAQRRDRVAERMWEESRQEEPHAFRGGQP